MTILLSLLFIRIFVYVNTLYYSIVLLAIVLSLLYILVSNLILHTLTMIIVAIVYIGAIIILIGYTCAICPNLILSPSHLRTVSYFFGLSAPFILFPINLVPVFNQIFMPITTYFYSLNGVLVFFTLIFILFVTLLIVTSQYITPKGPFRSVSIQYVIPIVYSLCSFLISQFKLAIIFVSLRNVRFSNTFLCFF